MTDEELKRLLALDSAPGPALAIDTAHADAIVDAALAGAGFSPGGGGDGDSSGGTPRGSGHTSGSGSAGGGAGATGGTMAAGTKLAIIAGAALVVVAIALFAWRGRRGGSEQLAAPTLDAAVDSAMAGTGAPAQPPSGDPALEDPSPDDPPHVDVSPDDSMREAARPRDDAPVERPRRAKPSRDPSPADEAADLLGEANAKRAAKQWRESDALYARVVRIAPKSLAAQTALVASASLHLEHLGDPKGAAQRFRRALALAPSGALAEDARWGLVEAARASGDAAGEAAALDEFLAHHPRSPLASRAKARRAELP